MYKYQNPRSHQNSETDAYKKSEKKTKQIKTEMKLELNYNMKDEQQINN